MPVQRFLKKMTVNPNKWNRKEDKNYQEKKYDNIIYMNNAVALGDDADPVDDNELYEHLDEDSAITMKINVDSGLSRMSI